MSISSALVLRCTLASMPSSLPGSLQTCFTLSLASVLVLACGSAGAPSPGTQPAAGASGFGGGGAPSAGVSGGGSGTATAGASGGSSAQGGAVAMAGGSGGTADTGGGGASGAAGAAPADPCATGPWTCVGVTPDAPYGSRSFDVPAQQNWVNTGLYLKAGQSATISETGTWQVDHEGDTIDHGDCRIGDLVARSGLHYKDQALGCVAGMATFTAQKDGVLFVGALTGNDLGETYESRATASGKKSVTVTSQGATVPTVQGTDAAGYAFGDVPSGWVEVWGEHVILTLPAESASKDAAVLARATGRLDDIYELEAELRGALPHHGQRLRFFPDGTQPGYMLAGNPVRMQLTLVSGGDQTRISRSGEAGTDIWGFAHEMGHDFSFAPHGFWTYQENTLESWCNLFSIYSLEKLGAPLHASTQNCTMNSTGNYDSWDAWGGLCFLRQFQFRYGWDFYEQYFDQIRDTTSTGGDPWTFVHDKFEELAGEDVSPLFDAWNVPR